MTVHFPDPYLRTPQHKITVGLVGLGGTGSQVLTCLIRLNETLIALDHPGIHVRAWDPDTVSIANKGRQLFYPTDIGLNKAIVLVSRANRSFGFDWEAYPEKFDNTNSNILITCVDTAATRIKIAREIKPKQKEQPHHRPLYWLDLGNLKTTGQALLGTVGTIKQPTSEHNTVEKLPNVIEKFPQILKIKEVDQGPSCSLTQAMNKQDLFINSILAEFGVDLLWKLFRQGMIRYQGCYVNLDTLSVNPIKIISPAKKPKNGAHSK